LDKEKIMEMVDLIFGYAEKFPGWLWLLVLFGPILAMLVFHLSLGMRRGAMWKKTALSLGYVYHDEDISSASTFKPLLSFMDVDGFETRSLDVLSSETDGVQKWLFDHATGQPRKLRTVCVMRDRELQVPHFRLLPNRGGSSLRQRDEQFIFQDDPDFSKIFVLTTNNPTAIKRFFDSSLRQHVLRIFYHCRGLEKSNTNWFNLLMLRLSNAIGRFEIEAEGDTLSIHLSRIINPCCASEFLALTAETLQLLKSRQSAMSQQQ
jgi:hypothetical protein